MAHRHHLNHPKGKDFQPKNTLWQQDKSLSRMEKTQLELDMATREHLEKQSEQMTRELARMSHEEPWASDMLYLMQVPGCGVVTGMTILAAIGDMNPLFKSFHNHVGLYQGLV